MGYWVLSHGICYRCCVPQVAGWYDLVWHNDCFVPTDWKVFKCDYKYTTSNRTNLSYYPADSFLLTDELVPPTHGFGVPFDRIHRLEDKVIFVGEYEETAWHTQLL